MQRIHLRSAPCAWTVCCVLVQVGLHTYAVKAQPPRPPFAAGASVITIGTPWTAVEAIMGPPKFSSVIPCLGRAKLIYDDGTEILLLHCNVISATPGGAAHGDLLHGYVIQRPGCNIYFEPVVLRAPGPGFEPDVKLQVERCYHFGPPASYPHVPPLHQRMDDHHHHHPQPPVGPRVRVF